MDSLIKMDTGIELSMGKLLISEPLLQDDNFHKSVIFLCYHSPKESLGFILNKQADQLLNFYLNDTMSLDFPVFIGGPVDQEMLHFIHSVPEIAGGEKITEDIYWSGDLEQIVEGIKMGKVTTDNCKFFIGYSGWGIGQLEAEIEMNAWLVAHSNTALVFNTPEKMVWNEAVKSLGKQYAPLLFMPENPELN
jgi:putative transcriptional regulator